MLINVTLWHGECAYNQRETTLNSNKKNIHVTCYANIFQFQHKNDLNCDISWYPNFTWLIRGKWNTVFRNQSILYWYSRLYTYPQYCCYLVPDTAMAASMEDDDFGSEDFYTILNVDRSVNINIINCRSFAW